MVIDDIMEAWERRDGAFWDQLVGLCDGERRQMIVNDALEDIVFSSALVAGAEDVKEFLDLCERHHLHIPPLLLERSAQHGVESLALVLPLIKQINSNHLYSVYLIAEHQNTAALELISSVLDLEAILHKIRFYAVKNPTDLKQPPIAFLEEFVAAQQREKLLEEIDHTHCARGKYNRKI